MKTIRRLVVSLDGTWNNRDDSTNVLYSHALAVACRERPVAQTNGHGQSETVLLTQERYYQEGVGTGPLDRLTGGGFGFGLDEHVRQAYNWLVQNFEDGDATSERPPDEIYIFGFSRGAYTARSLVGFISMCGLLRRGAPLTVSQLWRNYCVLGVAREARSGGLLGKAFGETPIRFRRLTDLAFDPWDRRAGPRVGAGECPRLRPGIELLPTEELLVRWSRRVRITYLGLFDTVGAVGWDALAIPGLRSRVAVQHNMRPTTIIQRCRHALAIDEHRSSFAHTPFMAYLGAPSSAEEAERDALRDDADPADDDHDTDWKRVEAMWARKIEQRWFVGAHSNIGGGYDDNRLAQIPMAWILEGARTARGRQGGLWLETLPAPTSVARPVCSPVDSFAEFAKPLWALVLRAKRHYRVLLPPPEVRATPVRPGRKNQTNHSPGFSLVSINESIDPSVLEYWTDSPSAPPNLIECARRTPSLSALAKKKVVPEWPGNGRGAAAATIVWATLASAGFAVADRWFCLWPSGTPLWILCLLAAVFPIVDWVESATNAYLARRGPEPWQRALADSIYWTRSVGVALFALGLVAGLLGLALTSWNASVGDAWPSWLRETVGPWAALAGSASAGFLLACLAQRTFSLRQIGTAIATLAGIAFTALLLAIGPFAIGEVVRAALGAPAPAASAVAPSASAHLAGLLLILQLLLIYFVRSFQWVGEPLIRANLGTIVPLQTTFTPARVETCLQRWQQRLGGASDAESRAALVRILQLALWRDALGFIPVYSGVMLFGLWFGTHVLNWGAPWTALPSGWLAVPLIALISDYLENAGHLRYLALYARQAKPCLALTLFTCTATLTKTVAFVAGMAAVSWAILQGCWRIAEAPSDFGLRGLVALAMLLGISSVGLALVLWAAIYRLSNRGHQNAP